jgi:hypothetical protein
LPDRLETQVAIARVVVEHFGGLAPDAALPFMADLPARDAEFRPPSSDSAWARELANVDEHGIPSKESALRLYALTFGDLPGVSVEHDGQPIRSGSAAIRAVLAHWNELTPEQRTAIEDALSLPEDAIVIEIGPVQDAIASAPPETRQPAGSERMAADSEYTQQVVAAVRSAGRWVREAIAARLGYDIPGKVDIAIAPCNQAKPGETSTEKDLGCAIGQYDSPRGPSPTGSGLYRGCQVRITGLGLSGGGGVVLNTLAHEIFHCFQDHGYQTLDRHSRAPGWVIEGGAEWVGNDITGDLAETDAWWDPWFTEEATSLLKRKYDAVGFWAHLAESGTNPYAVFPAVFRTNDGPTAFQASGAVANQRFLDSWASSLTRLEKFGREWDSDGPGIPLTATSPEGVEVRNGGSSVVQAAPYTARTFALEISADILVISGTGHARLGDSRIDTVSFPSRFCARQGGCGPCPGSIEVPPAPLLPGQIPVLALTGGVTGATYTVAGERLKVTCDTPPPTTPDPERTEFCRLYHDMLVWWFGESRSYWGSKTWFFEIVTWLEDMRPHAPADLLWAVDVYLNLYKIHATMSGPEAAVRSVEWAAQMGAATSALDAHCGIGPGDIPYRDPF